MKVITDSHIAFLISNLNHNVVILMVQETKVEYDKQYGSHKTTTAIMSNIKAAEYEDMFVLKRGYSSSYGS